MCLFLKLGNSMRSGMTFGAGFLTSKMSYVKSINFFMVLKVVLYQEHVNSNMTSSEMNVTLLLSVYEAHELSVPE